RTSRPSSSRSGGAWSSAPPSTGGWPPRRVGPMKAVMCKRFGGPDVLELAEMDEPTAGPGQVLVDVKACSVNFPDLLMIQDLYQFKPGLPFVPGSEVSGVVREVGDGVDRFTPGDRVL